MVAAAAGTDVVAGMVIVEVEQTAVGTRVVDVEATEVLAWVTTRKKWRVNHLNVPVSIFIF